MARLHGVGHVVQSNCRKAVGMDLGRLLVQQHQHSPIRRSQWHLLSRTRFRDSTCRRPPGSFCRTCRNLTRSRGGESSMGFLFTANDRFAEVAVAPRMSPVGRELSASTRWPGFSAYDAPDPHRSAVTIRYWERQIRLLRGLNCWQASKYRQELKSCDRSSYGPNRAKSRSSNSQFAGHMTLHPALVDHPSRLRVLLRHP
jgi:hypothetical protein